MTEASARANVIGPLRELLLIDETSRPTQLMEKWRHDDDYGAVCHEIRKKLYPDELVEAFPNPTSNEKERIKNWFMKNARVGEPAAKMYTDTYMLLSEADPSSAGEIQPRTKSDANPAPAKASSRTASKTKSAATKLKPEVESEAKAGMEYHTEPNSNFPSIHIDVQVHISPETSSEQIDKIFESMAKHLKKFKD